MAESSVSSNVGLSRVATTSAWTVVAAFGAYFCTYAFRKPFTAATFAGEEVAGFDYKSVLVAAQVLGYTCSKFLGIRIIAEFPPHARAVGIVALLAMAAGAWLAFPLVPPPLDVCVVFLNGLPLGMVFGLVLGYLEGRRVTEALTAGLCASFILADGAMKAVGASLLAHGVSERWMPVAAAGLFAVPLLACVAMLTRVPAPSAADVAQRAPRHAMSRDDRRRFLARFGAPLAMLTIAYFLVTVLRSLRADFSPELWRDLTGSVAPATYFWTEIWGALGVVFASGLTIVIANNRTAFFLALAVSLAGLLLVAAATAARQAGWIEPFWFMTALGLGLYLPYVAVHTTIFERLIAMTRERANIGYLMYLVDAFGYLGYVAVVLGKSAFQGGESFLQFFDVTSLLVAGGGAIALALAWMAFAAGPRVTVAVAE